MAKDKAKTLNGVKFNVDFYDNGAVLYKAGQTYPETEDTLHKAGLGHAEKITYEAANEMADEEPTPADLLNKKD